MDKRPLSIVRSPRRPRRHHTVHKPSHRSPLRYSRERSVQLRSVTPDRSPSYMTWTMKTVNLNVELVSNPGRLSHNILRPVPTGMIPGHITHLTGTLHQAMIPSSGKRMTNGIPGANGGIHTLLITNPQNSPRGTPTPKISGKTIPTTPPIHTHPQNVQPHSKPHQALRRVQSRLTPPRSSFRCSFS